MSSGKHVPPGFLKKHSHYGFMEKFKRLVPEDQAKVEAFVASLDDPRWIGESDQRVGSGPIPEPGQLQRRGADSPGETFTAPSTERLSPAQADTPRLPSDEPQSAAQSTPATHYCNWPAEYCPICECHQQVPSETKP